MLCLSSFHRMIRLVIHSSCMNRRIDNQFVDCLLTTLNHSENHTGRISLSFHRMTRLVFHSSCMNGKMNDQLVPTAAANDLHLGSATPPPTLPPSPSPTFSPLSPFHSKGSILSPNTMDTMKKLQKISDFLKCFN